MKERKREERKIQMVMSMGSCEITFNIGAKLE